MSSSTRLSIVEQALSDILDRLDDLPQTPRLRELRSRARAYQRAVAAWGAHPPAQDQRESMLRTVLDLNVEVMAEGRKMEQQIAEPPVAAAAGKTR